MAVLTAWRRRFRAGPSGLAVVVRNFLHMLGGKAGAGLISLVYLVIVARSLGAADYGVLVLLHGYVTMVGVVVAFSGWHGLVRYGALAIEEKNPERVLRLARFMALIELIFGMSAIGIAALFAPLIGPRLGWSPAALELALPYSLAVLATVRATPQGLVQLLGRFDLLGLHVLVAPIIRLAGALAVWGLDGGLTGYLIVWLAAAIGEMLSMWALGLWALGRLFPGHRLWGPITGVRRQNAGFLRFAVITNVDLSLQQLAPAAVPLTVGWLLGPAAAGMLSLAQRASVIFQQPANLLSNASYAVLTRLAAAGDIAKLRRTVLHTMMMATGAALPLLLLLAAFAETVLRLLGGPSYTDGVMLLVLMSVGRWIMLTASPLGAAVVALGHPARSIATGIAINLIFYPVLILLLQRWGLSGAGWHGLAQAMANWALLMFFFHRSLAETSPARP